MSFSGETKSELSLLIPTKWCCQVAELAALIRTVGSLQLAGKNGVGLTLLVEHGGVARKMVTLLRKLFNIHPEITVRRERRLKKANSYILYIRPGLEASELLTVTGVVGPNGEYLTQLDPSLVRRKCCRKTFLRGVFLGAGSVSKPGGDYHLELVLDHEDVAELSHRLLTKFGLRSRLSERKDEPLIYMKGSEDIVAFLSILGAYQALLEFENTRMVRGMRNQVNRQMNCETANVERTVKVGMRQADKIQSLVTSAAWQELSQPLQELAELRMENPEATLGELAEMCVPRLSKSCVQHRLRKLEQMADEPVCLE